MQNKLSYTRMKNQRRQHGEPEHGSRSRPPPRNADWAHADHFYMILTDQPGAESWPIENPTFVLFYKNPGDKNASKQALEFFKWAYANGDQMAESLLYIPLPESVTKVIEASWKQIQGSGM